MRFLVGRLWVPAPRRRRRGRVRRGRPRRTRHRAGRTTRRPGAARRRVRRRIEVVARANPSTPTPGTVAAWRVRTCTCPRSPGSASPSPTPSTSSSSSTGSSSPGGTGPPGRRPPVVPPDRRGGHQTSRAPRVTDSLALTSLAGDRAGAPELDRPPARRGLRQPKHPPGVRRGAPRTRPAASLDDQNLAGRRRRARRAARASDLAAGVDLVARAAAAELVAGPSRGPGTKTFTSPGHTCVANLRLRHRVIRCQPREIG